MLSSKSIETVVGVALSLVFIMAGVYSTTFATVNQALPTICVGLIGVMVSVLWSKEGKYNMLSLSATLLVGYLAIRAYNSPVEEYAYQDLFLILSGAIIFLIQNKAQNKAWFHKITIVGVLILVGMNLLMLVPSLNHFRDNLMDYASGTSKSGLFNHRNFFSNFMGMGVCLSLSLLIWMKSLIIKSITGLMVTCCVGAVFYSTNRASSIIVVIVLLVIILIAIWDLKLLKRVKLSSALLGLGVVIVAGILSFSVVSKKTFYDSGFKAQSNGRVDCWTMAVSQIPDAPLLGSGSRSFEYKSYEYWPDSLAFYEKDFKFVHSEYLQMITDYGIIGFVLSLFFIACFLYYAFSDLLLRRHQGFSQACLVAGTSAFIFALLHSSLSFPLHGYVNLIVLVYLSGFVFKSGDAKNVESVSQKKSYNRLFYGIVITVFSITSIFMPIKEFRAGLALKKYGIGGDDMNWTPREQSEKDWLAALEEANEISPRFSRAQKIGLLYMEKAALMGGSADLEKKAELFFKESIKLNPYYVVPEFNLAELYQRTKNYEESEKYYLHIDRRYRKRIRGNFFRYDRKLNSLYFEWLHHLLAENNLKEISRVLSKLEIHKKHRVFDGIAEARLVDVVESVALAKLHFSIKEKEKGYLEFDKVLKAGRSFYKTPGYLEWHINLLKNHANFVWYKHRNPERALIFFKAVKKEYKILSGLISDDYSLNVQLKESMKKVDKSIKMLEIAGFR